MQETEALTARPQGEKGCSLTDTVTAVKEKPLLERDGLTRRPVTRGGQDTEQKERGVGRERGGQRKGREEPGESEPSQRVCARRLQAPDPPAPLGTSGEHDAGGHGLWAPLSYSLI